MAAVTTDWVAIAGLTAETLYSIQHKAGGVVELAESDTVGNIDPSNAVVLDRPYRSAIVKPATGNNIYARATIAGSIAVNEAP